MKKYLIDVHVHTKETSNCGQTSAAQTVKLYHSLGYDGIMITDHLHNYTFKRKLKWKHKPKWEDKMNCFLKGYRAAVRSASRYKDFKVYLGAELRFDENDNDYLIFGLTEDKLRRMKGVIEMDHEDGIRFVQGLGCAVVQAHPFRNRCTIVKPGILDGIETHNGHLGHDSRNDIAEIWAEKFNYKIRTAGTDFHGEHDPNSGIYSDELPEDSEALMRLVMENRFTQKK